MNTTLRCCLLGLVILLAVWKISNKMSFLDLRAGFCFQMADRLSQLISGVSHWWPMSVALTVVLVATYVFRHLLCTKKPSITFKGPNLVIFCSLFFNTCKMKGYSSTQAVQNLFFQIICGLCLLYEKDRIFEMSIPWRSVVFFFKPETVEALLKSKEAMDKSNEYNTLTQCLGEGLLVSNGKKWSQRRKMLTPAFHFKILEYSVPIFQKHSTTLLSKLKKFENGMCMDFGPLAFSCGLGIICEAAMGVSVHEHEDGHTNVFHAMDSLSDVFLQRVIYPWLYYDFVFNLCPTGKMFKEDVTTFVSFTRKVIKNKKEEIISKRMVENSVDESTEKERKVFLELLLEQHIKDSSFTEEDVREEVCNFIAAGLDTSIITLNWTLYCLGLHEDVQRLAHQELDEIFEDGEREITIKDITRLNYLECVIKETLRLYTPVPHLARTAKESFDVLGHTVQRGSQCLISAFMLHRDPKSFPNPEKFNPERFFPENSAGRHPYAFIPFSAGTRNCIGQKFAMMELKAVVANILRNFTITSIEQRDRVNVLPGITLRNLDPLKLKFTPRHTNSVNVNK